MQLDELHFFAFLFFLMQIRHVIEEKHVRGMGEVVILLEIKHTTMKYHLLFTTVCLVVMISCRMADATVSNGTYDIVCGTKVHNAESFVKIYKGNTYYFDTYACKQLFTHKPEKYIHKPGSGAGVKYHPAKF